MENLSKIILVLLFLSSCSLTSTYYVDPVYEDHPHTTEVYWYTDYELGGMPYFGYWNNFYYYYGVPHFYPWWYYYQFIPPYHYYTHTHIHVHCDNGHYVYGHRGPTLNNNVAKDFRPTIKVKNKNDKAFVFPRDWKSSNSPRINKQDYNRTFNINQSKNNVYKNNSNTNVNRNINKNIRNNKINKGNGPTRSNKTNTSRKPK
jgi:hypothetical protein